MLNRLFAYKKKQEIIKKSNDRLDYVTVKEMAILANMAYLDLDNITPRERDAHFPDPKQWFFECHFVQSSYTDDPTDYGYRGFFACKMKDYGDYRLPCAMVFSHRGLVLTESNNLLGALAIAMNQVPMQIKMAEIFIDKRIYAFFHGDRYDWPETHHIPVYHVGHSLGSVIANCVYMRTKDEYHNHIDGSPYGGKADDNLVTVGFENPGTRKIVKNYLINKGMSEKDTQSRMDYMASKAHNYQADVNIINTCNNQYGNVNYVKIPYRYAFSDYPKLPVPSDQIPSSYLANLYYIRTHSFTDQHNMDNLVNYIKQGVEILDASERKHGFASGYSQYLDGDKRKDYWLGYFQIVWDNDEQIRKVFHDKYDSFANFMFEILREEQGKVLLDESNIVKQETFKFRVNNMFTLFTKQKQSEFVGTESNLHEFQLINRPGK